LFWEGLKQRTSLDYNVFIEDWLRGRMTELKLANIRSMTEEELERVVEDCFEYAPDTIPVDRLAILLEAQFYQTELDRRKSSWVEQRSFWLEIAVIVLILGEILLSIYGIRLAIREAKDDTVAMDKQNTILNDLQTSTHATASLLENELDLEYTLSINVEYGGNESMIIYNNSRSAATLAGIKLDGMVPRIRGGQPILIADHNQAPINFNDYDPKLGPRIAGGGKPFSFPVELYLSNAQGKEFVWKGRLTSLQSSGNLEGSPSGTLNAEQWSQSIKILPTPSTAP